MRKMWSFLLAALALTGCAAAPADALPAAETAETAEMTTTETEEAAAQPVGFTVGNLSEVPNTCGCPPHGAAAVARTMRPFGHRLQRPHRLPRINLQ